MTRYRISPDGKRLVFLSRKGEGPRNGNRRVVMTPRKSRRKVAQS